MDFIRKLLGLDRTIAIQEEQEYVDPVFHFHLEIPPKWRRMALVPEFQSTGGRIALAHPDGAVFNVSCGPLDPGIPEDKIARAVLAAKYLAQSVAFAIATPLRDVTTEIPGEDNVARVEVATRQGFEGLISILHHGVEFTLQYQGNDDTRPQLEALITSFGLPGFLHHTLTHNTDFSTAILGLDTANQFERQSARDILVNAGVAPVPALLTSVQACNQAIMVSANYGPLGMESRIDALCSRIEILGKIGDERGIPAMLNAIGDSSQSKQISPAAQRLYITSQDALVSFGSAAVVPIAKVLNTPSASIRQALAEVLVKIGDAESHQLLKGMQDDPDAGLRAIARSCTETFKFEIVRKEIR